MNVSDEDISQFLEENENKNTARMIAFYFLTGLNLPEHFFYVFTYIHYY